MSRGIVTFIILFVNNRMGVYNGCMSDKKPKRPPRPGEGRPTKYCPDILDKARHYVDHHNEPPYNDPVPIIQGLALAIKVASSTVYLWGEDADRSEFSEILGEVMDKQAAGLLRGGLTGEFNSTITKLMLTKHDYSDKTESNHTGNIAVETITRRVVDGA